MNGGRAKRFLFRCDVCSEVGFGHLRRCVALAKHLATAGSLIDFACRIKNPSDLLLLQSLNAKIVTLPWKTAAEADAGLVTELCHEHETDFVIIDHYRADLAYQQILQAQGVRWLQFDWAAQGPLLADIVVSPSPAASWARYRHIAIKESVRLLLGPRYVILSSEFNNPELLRTRDGSVGRALILMGGGGDRGAISLVLDALMLLPEPLRREIYWEIISGGANPDLDQLRARLDECSGALKAQLIVNADNVAARISKADLAITAGGTVSYETAVLHCPNLIISIADNQVANAMAWDGLGTSKYLGGVESLVPYGIAESIASLVNSPATLKIMSEAASSIIDSQGSERVAKELLM